MSDLSSSQLLEQPYATVPDLVRAHTRERPSHVALIHNDRRVTYAELDSLMDRIAASLQRDGLQMGDVVAICGSSSIEYSALYLGALRAGVAVAPLAPSTPEGLAAMVTDCGATHLFIDASATDLFATTRGQLKSRIVALDDSEGDSLSTWLEPAHAKPLRVEIPPLLAFNIIYSSGTTGTPKGIVQSHQMRWMHVLRSAINLFDTDTVTLLATPLYSNTTLVAFFPTIAHGGTVVLMAKFDAEKYLVLAQKHRATHTMLVPVQYQRIMALPSFGDFDLSSYKMKQCTSAPFAATLKADILKRWPGGLVDVYGMTEGGGTCTLRAHEHPDKLHTVGKPAPDHDIRLLDEDGNEVGPGEIGEVVGHSPAMMNHYHNQPQKTAEAEWYDRTGKRFIRTGDCGRFDAEGFLQLMDRKKDMIISGGFNIYPSDLEATMREHPAVADVAVIGVPSEKWGETPVAYVVLKPAATVAGSELAEWFNSKVGKTQRVAALEVVEQLPRSAIGKVLKRELRDDFAKLGIAV